MTGKHGAHYQCRHGGHPRVGIRVGSPDAWRLKAAFDEFLLLRFEAVSEPPFRFALTDEAATCPDYGAVLVRLSHQYEASF